MSFALCESDNCLRDRIYVRIYIAAVRFAWDEGKSERNLATRRFDFAFATSIFLGPTLERIDARQDDGEVRRIALGNARWDPAHRDLY